LRVAEADAVAAAQRMIALDAHAVQVRAVRAAAVLQDPRALPLHDLRVLAREITVLDGDRAVGRAADRHAGAVELVPERREERRVDRDLGAGSGGIHSYPK